MCVGVEAAAPEHEVCQCDLHCMTLARVVCVGVEAAAPEHEGGQWLVQRLPQ